MLPAIKSRLVKVNDRRPVCNVLRQLVGKLDPFCLQQFQVVSVRIEVRVRSPKADSKAPVEPAQALAFDLDLVDLLDLCAPLLYGQVRPVSQALGV